jgi:hypothetical protein
MSERTRVQQVRDGLSIVAKYDDADIAAEHDTIYVWSDSLTDEDKKELKNCGFLRNDDESWLRFLTQ